VRVDKELVGQIVVQVLGQLAETHGTQNVLILGSRNVGTDIPQAIGDGATRALYYSDEAVEVGQIDRYFLPRLELSDMADLALGKTNSPRAEEVLKLLLGGKTVEVLEYAYSAFESTAPPRLFQLYCDYAETLSGFGLRPVQQAQKTTRLNSKVISEKDMEKCHADGITRIGITGKALVTSLAEECAKKFGIEIQRD
jgi:ethanolamine utilization protein